MVLTNGVRSNWQNDNLHNNGILFKCEGNYGFLSKLVTMDTIMPSNRNTYIYQHLSTMIHV